MKPHRIFCTFLPTLLPAPQNTSQPTGLAVTRKKNKRKEKRRRRSLFFGKCLGSVGWEGHSCVPEGRSLGSVPKRPLRPVDT